MVVEAHHLLCVRIKLIPNREILSAPFTMRLEKLHNRAMSTVGCEAGGTHKLNAAVTFRVGPSFQEKLHRVEAAMLRRHFESCTAPFIGEASASIDVGTTSDKASYQTDEAPFSGLL